MADSVGRNSVKPISVGQILGQYRIVVRHGQASIEKTVTLSRDSDNHFEFRLPE